ncbi:ATP-binding protein [Nonomuraea sp. KC401]|uniref:ATP-binding protein n=1 Tax=unclassified Nonomuraea TaxID=2593643 RepID=UPI0010FEDE66|nr:MULTISPECIES: ATP-binding protein [unclassified Nonomuraea]NBE99596.1 ATP-binding protein [Nonomuraea sp. K271]TLF56780.1 ATP-binding protein [Nonomuraea sp. KC401]
MGNKEAQPYHVDTRLPEEMGSITASRQIIGEALAARGYQGQHEDVLLVVSELVTNALVHGDGPPSLRMRADAFSVRIEVSDAGADLPRPREPGPGDGWGLHVVRLLSTGWGIAPVEGGKTVWCELTAGLTRIRPAEI